MEQLKNRACCGMSGINEIEILNEKCQNITCVLSQYNRVFNYTFSCSTNVFDKQSLMATDIEIFVGTSQEFLLSFKVKKTEEDEHFLERYIAHRCHNGAIIAMDTKGRYLATGGGDDRIVVIDLKLNRDVHEIVCHEGTINSLLFNKKGSDLLSGSEDGRLVATNTGSWKSVKTWKKPHTGKSVLKVCLHPSDKFALTLGKDGTLRGWDMCKGSQINTFNTKDFTDAAITLDNIELSPDGSKFAMSGAKTVTIMNLAGEEPCDELTLKSRATSMCWLDGQNLLIGLEDGSVEWLNVKTSEHTNIPGIHKKRVKDMHCLNEFLGTICTSGAISLWATTIPTKQLTLICTIDEGIRPTCIKLIDITENRFKEKFELDTQVLKESLPRSVKNSQPISTTRKVVVETDRNENSDILKDQDIKQEVIADSDTDTEIVITTEKSSKRKKSTKLKSDGQNTETVTNKKKSPPASVVALTKPPKKKKLKVSPVEVTSTTAIETEESGGKKRKNAEITVPKPIVVRSPNLDDDFETPKTKLKKKKRDIPTVVKGNKKTLNLSLTAVDNASPIHKKKTKATTPLSCPAVQQNGSSQDDATPIRKKKTKATTPLTCPAVQQNGSSQDDATPIRKKKTKATTPLTCPTVQQNHSSQDDATPIRKKKKVTTPMSCPATQLNRGSQQSKKKRQKLEMDTSETAVTRNRRKLTM